VGDDYRAFEQLDSTTVDWIKAEGTYTRQVLDAIPKRAGLQSRLETFHGQVAVAHDAQVVGEKLFYLFRAPDADDFDLMVREAERVRKVVDIRALRQAHGNTPYAINYFLASPDGSRVAVGISKNGSEDAVLSVYDSSTAREAAGPIDRDEFGLNAWSSDSSTLFLNRLRKLQPGDAPSEKARDTTIDAWDMRTAPTTVFSRQLFPGISATDTPQFVLSTSSRFAYLRLEDGANPNIAIYAAPKDQMLNVKAWRLIVSHDDGVTAFSARDSKLFLLSNQQAPTFKVLELDANGSLADARTLLAASPQRIIDSIHVAADGVYVVARSGIYSKLLLIGPTSKIHEIPLPERGQIMEAATNGDREGIVFAMLSWTIPLQVYAYRSDPIKLENLRLAPKPHVKMAAATIMDVTAPALDGVGVPLTVVTRRGDSTNRPMILQVYGSYGISYLPGFDPSMMQFLNEGGAFAICHVRGGGELGEAWRLGGKDANKHNTWDDLVACARELIRRQLTTHHQLIIYGASAGGIVVGRAATEHPELFAGVIDNVPPANMLRMEYMPEGSLETQEFGSDKTEAGFRNLLEMDTYHHVKPGVSYPPFLIGMGLNDPRIAAWQPAKLAARLQSLGDSVLLRVDLENGHGVGGTRLQYDSMSADFLAFAFWKAGQKGWQPTVKH
jgi:prolyl oligopeptidase